MVKFAGTAARARKSQHLILKRAIKKAASDDTASVLGARTPASEFVTLKMFIRCFDSKAAMFERPRRWVATRHIRGAMPTAVGDVKGRIDRHLSRSQYVGLADIYFDIFLLGLT